MNSGRFLPALTRWFETDRVGVVGLSVLVAALVLAVGLAVHGYHDRGLGPVSVGASAVSSSARDQTTTSTTTGGSPSPTRGSTPPTTSPPSKLGPALSSTQYASYAFRIYPGPVSASAQQAMAGYSIRTELSGSNVVVVVSVPGSSQSPSRTTYLAADSVYFIEANLGDDSGATELNPGDDGLIVTNPQGRIVEA